ncbi:polysaccharide deacetylase family protein [uncultured Sphingomonas sp.]|uniref:polysaccharide deacetylase family protein n=1 Tax=uncultured Sphingomonas sp. TaxID=158754 RepID=UPI0035CC65C0
MIPKYLSFCFDDGFRRTADKVRRIFEARGLSACFCVLSAPELAEDPGIKGATIADWEYWRDAAAAGHEIGPHGHAHEVYGQIEPYLARRSIEECWRTLERELPGFDRRSSLFHVPYLSAPAELVEWIGMQSLGARVMLGHHGLNPLPGRMPSLVDCACFGPDLVGAAAMKRLNEFEHQQGWLVFVFHGLDDEGWGPVNSDEMEILVDRALAARMIIAPPSRLLLESRGHSLTQS